MNNIKTWRQGAFVNQRKYSHWSQEQIEKAQRDERKLVRPAPTENAICHCNDPNDAKWIADRLNLAAELEQLSYDFATGKTDGCKLVDFVQSKI